jgi:hypothetical protein
MDRPASPDVAGGSASLPGWKALPERHPRRRLLPLRRNPDRPQLPGLTRQVEARRTNHGGWYEFRHGGRDLVLAADVADRAVGAEARQHDLGLLLGRELPIPAFTRSTGSPSRFQIERPSKESRRTASSGYAPPRPSASSLRWVSTRERGAGQNLSRRWPKLAALFGAVIPGRGLRRSLPLLIAQ